MPPRSQSGSVAIDVLIEAGAWPSRARLKKLASTAITKAATRSRAIAPGTEVSIVFTDDAHIRLLNREHRRKDKATNVLSFPAAPVTPGTLGPLLGDIVLASETVAAEAAAEGISVEAHLTHLVVHGFLHLLGYDHAAKAEADAMEGLETAILGELGVADPYARLAAGGRKARPNKRP